MSAPWRRALGLMMVSASLVVGCSGANRIDVGGACVLNSDCNQGLVCTWGKCHVACHASADCQPGQSCITVSAQSTMCESPTACVYNSDCPTGLMCAVDQQCRTQCQTNVDCTSGQICTSTKTCAELSQVDSNNNLLLPDGGVTGSGGVSGAGGAGGSGGAQAEVPDARGAQPDVYMGGTGGGKSGSGGTSGNGGAWSGTAPSCSGLATTCGPLGTDDCCQSLLVSGGTFDRSYDGVDFTDPNYPATVDDFYLDKYEITVGRFRQFVNAGMGTQASPPAASTGAHPGITSSGWDSKWNTNLSATTDSLKSALKCYAGYQTWTDTAGSNESQPMNCLDWYTAFAFCAWDGGRLPTEAEGNYAASGGSEQRYYPWSISATSTTIDDSYAVYCGGSCSGTQNVGSKSPKGDGKWGQADLAGNVWEWNLDWQASSYPMPCSNCAELTTASSSRVVRGGNYSFDASALRSAYRNKSVNLPGHHDVGVGARCARTGP